MEKKEKLSIAIGGQDSETNNLFTVKNSTSEEKENSPVKKRNSKKNKNSFLLPLNKQTNDSALSSFNIHSQNVRKFSGMLNRDLKSHKENRKNPKSLKYDLSLINRLEPHFEKYDSREKFRRNKNLNKKNINEGRNNNNNNNQNPTRTPSNRNSNNTNLSNTTNKEIKRDLKEFTLPKERFKFRSSSANFDPSPYRLENMNIDEIKNSFKFDAEENHKFSNSNSISNIRPEGSNSTNFYNSQIHYRNNNSNNNSNLYNNRNKNSPAKNKVNAQSPFKMAKKDTNDINQNFKNHGLMTINENFDINDPQYKDKDYDTFKNQTVENVFQKATFKSDSVKDNSNNFNYNNNDNDNDNENDNENENDNYNYNIDNSNLNQNDSYGMSHVFKFPAFKGYEYASNLNEFHEEQKRNQEMSNNNDYFEGNFNSYYYKSGLDFDKEDMQNNTNNNFDHNKTTSFYKPNIQKDNLSNFNSGSFSNGFNKNMNIQNSINFTPIKVNNNRNKGDISAYNYNNLNNTNNNLINNNNYINNKKGFFNNGNGNGNGNISISYSNNGNRNQNNISDNNNKNIYHSRISKISPTRSKRRFYSNDRTPIKNNVSNINVNNSKIEDAVKRDLIEYISFLEKRNILKISSNEKQNLLLEFLDEEKNEQNFNVFDFIKERNESQKRDSSSITPYDKSQNFIYMEQKDFDKERNSNRNLDSYWRSSNFNSGENRKTSSSTVTNMKYTNDINRPNSTRGFSRENPFNKNVNVSQRTLNQNRNKIERNYSNLNLQSNNYIQRTSSNRKTTTSPHGLKIIEYDLTNLQKTTTTPKSPSSKSLNAMSLSSEGKLFLLF